MKPPHISKELIDYLKSVYPDRAPDLTEDERTIWAKVGSIRVVRHLTMLHEEQIEQALGTN